jgi:acylglycerol lipase
MDFNIKLSNGYILRGFIKSPGDNIRAVLILVHGVGEHIGRYEEWFDLFNRERIGFAGVNLPGHGSSDGKRGYIKSYSITDEMIEILLSESKKTFPGIPQFLYGQSLGGGIVIDYLIRKNPKIRGGIITSPWLKLAFEPDKWKVRLVSVLGKVVPQLLLPSGLVVEHLSHDQEVLTQYKNDPLVHDRISLSLYCNAVTAAGNSLKNASELKIPLLILHGSDDHICSPEGSKEFASKSKSTQLRIWDEGYHELHNEVFKKDVFDYIINWINSLISE